MEDVISKRSILAGMLIGIGVIINTLSDNKYVGAMLFSLALLVIVQCGLLLYTGKIGFIETIPIKNLMLILINNLFGCLLIVVSVLLCNSKLKDIMTIAAQEKFSHSGLELFILGFMCGILMLIAVYSKNKIITIFCIMTFILSNYQHCIANIPYLFLCLSFENIFKFICIVLGNSIGSIFTYKLIGRTNEIPNN